jgi:CrcB protein
MERLLWVCIAGGIGSGVRYLVGIWTQERFGAAFPLGTLAVNVVGCFLAAAILDLAVRAGTIPPNLRLALVTGFCGGLTTYSSFNYETTKLALSNAPSLGLVYFGVTTVACLASGLAGAWCSAKLVGG